VLRSAGFISTVIVSVRSPDAPPPRSTIQNLAPTFASTLVTPVSSSVTFS
jgi:hypothetical protein